jgi:hypothetical protein
VDRGSAVRAEIHGERKITTRIEVSKKMSTQTVTGYAAPPPITTILIRGVVLAMSCVISYWLITHILAYTYSVSRDDDLLGGMWTVVATIFVYRQGEKESVHSALSRMAATFISFALCLAYFVFLPFHLWGMAVLIGISAVLVPLIGRPDDTITTCITIAVLMVVAQLSPHAAWRQPILRLVDTAVGVAVGVAGVWTSSHWTKRSSAQS